VDRLWSPWRYRYVTSGDKSEQPKGCIFCADREEHYILFAGKLSFGLLNRYPYTSGHMMVAPYAHIARLEDLDEAAFVEMMRYGRIAERNLRAIYRCDGLNIGFNIGSVAGAGVAGHLHLHLVPRWNGDANFMSTIGETRVLPEDLEESARKLRAASWALEANDREALG
jgi:ATP adenylyltransferase